MRRKSSDLVLEWLVAHGRGGAEELALALKLKPLTVYAALRALVASGHIEPDGAATMVAGRGRTYKRQFYRPKLRATPPAPKAVSALSSSSIVAKALAARSDLCKVWGGARC